MACRQLDRGALHNFPVQHDVGGSHVSEKRAEITREMTELERPCRWEEKTQVPSVWTEAHWANGSQKNTRAQLPATRFPPQGLQIS